MLSTGSVRVYLKSGTTNRESIKRLMFYKDQDKLMRYVHFQENYYTNLFPSSIFGSATETIFPRLGPSSPPTIWQEPYTTQADSTIRQEINNRSMLQQTASALSTLDMPKYAKPALLRPKRPAEETTNPPKVFIISPQKSSNEGVRLVPVRLTPASLAKGVTPPVTLTGSIGAESPPLPDTVAKTVPFTVQTSEQSENSSITSSTSMNTDKSALTTDRDTATPSTASTDSSTNNASSNAASDNNYFKCGNKGCTFEASTSVPLINHLVICDLARHCQKLSCTSCNRVFKQVGSFVEHLRKHGPERYSCSICPFKASLLSRVNSHMKACHQVFTTNLVPVDFSKRDTEKDYFIVSGKDKRRGAEKPGMKGKAKMEMKTKFSLEELDEVPNAAIFQTPLGCRICSYETKVRSNLMRHIQQHKSGYTVPQEEVVNPVPDKTEKMFDKMMNLAGSSHKKKPGPEGTQDLTAVTCMYKYVPDQDRYMCHLKECGYRTLSDTMLRDHISVIHKDETHYVCPHCGVLPIPVDQLSMHLKLHDCPVFKCAYCDFCSHIRRSIERHTEIAHPDEMLEVQAVRLIKSDKNLNPTQQPSPKLQSTEKSDEQGEAWYWCNHCVFKTKKRKIMLKHGIMEHKMTKPFMCSSCGYGSLTEHLFKDHFSNYHQDQNCELISLYKKVTEVKKPVLPPIPPLWKRDAKRLKLIRGIKLDEKGDAPPPVATATTGIKCVDVLELMFGHFGKPNGTHFMCPRCATTFICKTRQEMREHLFKDLQYSPILCKICKMGSTQRTKVMKHINKTHNVEWHRISELMDINANEELESWVEKVLERQQSLMSETPSTPADGAAEPPRKRRRSSVEASGAPPAPNLESPASPSTVQCTSTEAPDNESPLSSQESADDGDEPKGGRDKQKRDKCPSRHRFSCEYCEVTTKYKHSIVLHCKKVHSDLLPKVNIIEKTMDEKADAYNCMYCSCTSLNLNNLKHHWTYTHKNSGLNFLFRNTIFSTELEYECYWCKKRSDLETLKEHCRVDHSADQRFLVVSISVPKYKCSECNLVFKSVEMLKRHFPTAHPSSGKCCYIVVNKQRPAPLLDETSLSSSSQPKTSHQSKSSLAYKCFNCPFISSQFWPMVKHMHRHFVTFVCAECESLFPTASELNSHVLSKHPASIAKPHVLKGSETDIENAKKNIVVILESGVKRKITEEELAEAEKEIKPEVQDSDIYTYDEPLEIHMSPPSIKETARKSTGSPKYLSTPPRPPESPLLQQAQKSPSRPKKSLFKIKRKRLSLMNTFVTVKSHGKFVRLPAETLKKLINFDGELVVKTNVI